MPVASVATVAGSPPGWAATALTGQVLDLATLRSEQQAVVTADHRPAIAKARFAVDELTNTVSGDQDALRSAADAQARARAAQQAAAARLSQDRAALTSAVATVGADDARLAHDRAALRSIAIGLYTGQITDPQPTSLHALETDQQQVIYSAEVETVAGVVDSNLGRDLTAARAAARDRARVAARVAGDDRDVRAAAAEAGTAGGRVAAARDALRTDAAHLSSAEHGLQAADTALTAALHDVAGPGGPSATGGLSLIGGAALDAAQLVSWYDSQGYVDLTSAPIGQLAAWYLSAGRAEGIRGDVAFAQAVLETGGFSSPDSVNLNNYAGIGHCDSCAAGWAFPSAHAGVLGQAELLRIFADGSPPPGSPKPVLAALIPSRQGRRGCCSTWESLTGVWATDPSYGTQIIGIYQQMLAAALARRSG